MQVMPPLLYFSAIGVGATILGSAVDFASCWCPSARFMIAPKVTTHKEVISTKCCFWCNDL